MEFKKGTEYHFRLPEWKADDEFHLKIDKTDDRQVHVYWRELGRDDDYGINTVSYYKAEFEKWIGLGHVRPLAVVPAELFEL